VRKLLIAVGLLGAAVIVPTVALAAGRVTLKNPKCPSKINTKAQTINFSCTVRGSGMSAPLRVSAKPQNANGSTATGVKGTFTLKVRGKTRRYSVTGPIGADKQGRITINARYRGAHGARGTFVSKSPPQDPTGDPAVTIKGTL